MRIYPHPLTADLIELEASEASAARGGGAAIRYPFETITIEPPLLPVTIVLVGVDLTGAAA
ncbi:MAG TPA: hypothetical protein VFQ38_05705 [Longimicrobiales bacterium]|nr:hypothetical protein [Longimicrobiales bacterium]